MRPGFLPAIALIAAWQTRNVPLRFTSMTASHASSPSLRAVRSFVMPALLITMWTAPSSAIVLANAASTSAFFDTSQTTWIALPPEPLISSTVLARPSALTSRHATAAPSLAKRFAVAAPMPLAAPVTSATLFENLTLLLLRRLRTASHHEHPLGLDDDVAVLVQHGHVERDHAAGRVLRLLAVLHRHHQVHGLTELHGALVLDRLLHEGDRGPLEDAHLVREARGDGHRQHAVRDAGLERRRRRERLVGVQRVEVARDAGEVHHVGLGDRARRRVEGA